MKNVIVLGFSGSIGTQAADILYHDKDNFNVVGFSIGYKTRTISHFIKKFPNAKHIFMRSEKSKKYYAKKYPQIHFYSEEDDGLKSLIINSNCDMVINALVGFVGFMPSIVALKNNKILCLANKESLVVGGELINELLNQGNGKLYPIDSEHVAISKCLHVDNKNVKKIIITASGGAFRDLNRDQLIDVTVKEALNHPTWKMGNKITIDSATLVNKTFEIIEAHYLFNYPYNKIDVLLHKESYVHSLISYKNGTFRADISKPDMHNPIKWALYEGNISYKTYLINNLNELDKFHFKPFDINRYPIVKFAKKVIDRKGTYGACLNASNEVAVRAFLNEKIKFLDIEYVINKCMGNHKNITHPSYEDIVKANNETIKYATKLVNKLSKERN